MNKMELDFSRLPHEERNQVETECKAAMESVGFNCTGSSYYRREKIWTFNKTPIFDGNSYGPRFEVLFPLDTLYYYFAYLKNDKVLPNIDYKAKMIIPSFVFYFDLS